MSQSHIFLKKFNFNIYRTCTLAKEFCHTRVSKNSISIYIGHIRFSKNLITIHITPII